MNGVIASALLAVTQAPPPLPPADWSSLPPLALPVRDLAAGEPSAYVRGEVAAGRCRAVSAGPGLTTLVAPVAVLIDSGGLPIRIVPQAIGCPTVEQYTAGYVSTLLRGTFDGGGATAGWHRLPITYRW